MLKAVVFDDEYIVVEGLQTMIDWQSFGIELVGTAEDGISALALCRAHRPDVILTDIRMPEMDGLQLVEIVLREAPDTYCIVFSGFNDFSCVKRAIQLGVADYLEKPITVESVEHAIRKMTGRLTAQREAAELRQRWEEGKRELLEKATLDVLLRGEEAQRKWKEYFGPQADRVVGVTVIACSGQVRLPEQPEHRMVSIRNGEEASAVFFHFLPPSYEFWERLAQESELADVVVGGGRTYAGPADAADSYAEAKRALRCGLFLRMKGLIRYEQLGELIATPEGLSEREEAMILSMRAGDVSGLMEQIDRFLDWIRSEKVDPEVAEREMIKLIYIALEASKEGGAGTLEERFVPHVEIREMLAKGRMLEWFRERMERIAAWSKESRETTKHASVERARLFIEQNLSRNLSLEEVAAHVGMNPSYLSVLIKEVLGETYIKYVTRSRMELAKRLLSRGGRVHEVCEQVGYYSYKHFSEVFKKYAGSTPGQYKEGLSHPKKTHTNQ